MSHASRTSVKKFNFNNSRPRVIEDMLSEESLHSLTELKVFGLPQFQKECKELKKNNTRQVCHMNKLHENN